MEFLLWIRDVKKLVKEEEVTTFVYTFQMKIKKAKIGHAIVDYSTQNIAKIFKLPTGGVTIAALPDLTREKEEQLFECGINWVRDEKWNLKGAKHHWKEWFEFVNAHLLFKPYEHCMDQKVIVAALQTWEGVKVDWALIIQKKMKEEIFKKRICHPTVLNLYSTFFISCLCKDVNSKVEEVMPRKLIPLLLNTLGTEAHNATTNLVRIMELEKELAEKKNKIEQLQEKNATSLQQIN